MRPVLGGVIASAAAAGLTVLSIPINSCNVCNGVFYSWICTILCGW